MRRYLFLPSTMFALALLGPLSPGHAQAIERADALHDEGRAADALALLDSIVEAEGPGPDVSWRAARTAVNLGMLAEEGEEAKSWFLRAEAYAEARIAVEPEDARAWEWLGVARGRRTLTEGLRTRATLVNGVREASLKALALDSTLSGAHHVLAMWHAEIRRLNTFERLGAGALGADDFGEASWDAAVEHLERAVALAPEALVHRLELARVYEDVDRRGDAITQLRTILELEGTEPSDAVVRLEAESLLGELEGG
jgi:tetratricopeptide (TPR) repeat protein